MKSQVFILLSIISACYGNNASADVTVDNITEIIPPLNPFPPGADTTTAIPLPTTTTPTAKPTSKPTVSPTPPPSPTTAKPTAASTTTPASTTVAPTSTTLKPTSPIPTPTEKPTASPPKPTPNNRQFDGPSFVGGIVLAAGLMAIGFVAFKFYKARTDLNYHTL